MIDDKRILVKQELSKKQIQSMLFEAFEEIERLKDEVESLQKSTKKNEWKDWPISGKVDVKNKLKIQ
jgi:hypothetical protein